MVEIFRTNVNYSDEAASLCKEIQTLLKADRVSFDLHDCDRILRIQTSATFNPSLVIMALDARGYWAEVLPDEVPLPANSLL